jgi:hypothetical protein
MAEVWRKRSLRITVDRALGERLSEGVWRKLDRMTMADGAVREKPRKARHIGQGFQGSRIEIKLAQLFRDDIPPPEVLSDSELVDLVRKALEKDPKKTGLGIPHRKTILRQAGRIPRNK